jgi:RNA polymerase sigma-70 factor (ECF subfamily)
MSTRGANVEASPSHDQHDVDKEAARADESALVERARAGDHEAFRTLYQRYHRRVYSLAYGVVQNADDALDVVQDGFIKAHRYLAKFEGNSSFYTWLYRIVMNLSIDHIRKHKRGRHVDFDDAIAHGQDEGALGEDALVPRILGQNPGKSLVRKEMREQISMALAELSENHRAVLVMRELDGMSYEEMAQAMQCSKGTIMSRLFHARRNMQKRLLEYMGGQKDLEA